MSIRRSGIRCGSVLAFVLAGVLIGAAAIAQGPGGPGGGGQGGRGGRGGGGFRGFGMRGAPTAGNTSIEVLDRALKLTATQKTQIQAIKDQARTAMRALMPQRTPGAAPTRPDQAQMQQMMAKFQAQDKADSAKIEAVLTSSQKKTLATILAEGKDYRAVGFPIDATSALKLTASQKSKIVAIAAQVAKAMPQPGAAPAGGPGGGGFQAIMAARQKAHDDAVALLTADQKATLTKITPQRRGGFGGPGGPGGPGGGRRGGRGGAPGAGA